jgi:hypothetical protein
MAMISQGPPDNIADAMEYLKQGTAEEQENAQAIISAIILLEVLIIAVPDDGDAVIAHLTDFLERHKGA